MLFISKVLLGAAVLAGVCGSVAAPVILGFTKKVDNPEKNLEGNQDELNFPLGKCPLNNKEGLKVVSFGDNDTKKVCWAVAPENGVELTPEISEEYSKLLRVMWQNSKNWSTATDNWGIQCSTGNKWLFGVTAPEGIEYLGYCDDSKPEMKNQWIKIEDKNQKDWKLQICSGECFAKNSMYDGWESLSAAQPKGNWREIKFYSQ